MTQFEFDQLMMLAGAMDRNGDGKPEEVRHAYRRCASDLRQLLRHADTSPGAPPEGEPDILPQVPRSPRVPTFGPEET